MSLSCASALVILGELLVFLISAAVVFSHRPEHLGRLDVQTHLSPATSLVQTGQFTYQAEQKIQSLSMTLFLSLLDENQCHARCEIYHLVVGVARRHCECSGGEVWTV